MKTPHSRKKGRPDNGAASIKRGRGLLAVNEVGGSEQVYIIDAHQNNGEVVTTRAPSSAVVGGVNQQIAVGRAGNEHNFVEGRKAEQTCSISSCGRSLNGDRCRAGYFAVRRQLPLVYPQKLPQQVRLYRPVLRRSP